MCTGESILLRECAQVKVFSEKKERKEKASRQNKNKKKEEAFRECVQVKAVSHEGSKKGF